MRDAGFDDIIVLEAAEWIEQPPLPTLLLAIRSYRAEERCQNGAWIHPYYIQSQLAYLAAQQLVAQAQEAGIRLVSRDDIRVKPIFARMPGVSQGRNTLSYIKPYGSRFHLQIFLCDQQLEATHHPEEQHDLRECSGCHRCWDACPTGALDAEGFHREKCLRNWMLNGKPLPEELREPMQNRFIGCDDCQACCPRNQAPASQKMPGIDMQAVLRDGKASAARLAQQIGVNLAIPNRVLAQMLIAAGNSGEAALLADIRRLTDHPSPVVREHARWAEQQLTEEKAMKLQGIIFDLDGVICSTDDYHYLAWKALANRLGIPFDRTINNRLRGVSRMESLDIILEKSTVAYTDEEKLAFATEKNDLYRESLKQMSPADLSEEVRTILDALRARGLKLAIGSSSKNTPFILERIGLGSYFDFIADGNCITHSKPDPEVFLKAAEGIGLAPSACLVVEDAKAGVQAAVTGGFACAAMGDAKEDERATYHLNRFADLMACIKE